MSFRSAKNIVRSGSREISRSNNLRKNKKVVVLNGNMKGIFMYYQRFPDHYIITNTSEEELYKIKQDHTVQSYYLYDPSDLKGMTIDMVGMPTIYLYDDFVNIKEP